jgi:hypothetical protein
MNIPDVTTKCIQSYVNRLNDADLHARGGESRQKYLQRYLYNIFSEKYMLLKWTLLEAQRMTMIMREADSITRRTRISKEMIPWKLILISNHIENGFTHTQGDTIFLSRSDLLQREDHSVLKTLLHEKIHILQRQNPDWMENVSRTILGYKRIEATHSSYFRDQYRFLMRSNPDIDSHFYAFQDSFVPIMLYSTSKPRNLHDASVQYFTPHGQPTTLSDQHQHIQTTAHNIWQDIYQTEHPYEVSACMIANALFKRYTHVPLRDIEKKILQSILTP